MRTAIVAVVALCFSVPVAAQMGTLIPQKPNILPADQVRKVQEVYGQCEVKAHRTAAIQYVLQEDLDDKTRQKLVSQLADDVCLGQAMTALSFTMTMRMPAETLRYTLADALVRGELATTSITSFARVPPLPTLVLGETSFQPKPGENPTPRRLKELADARVAAGGAIFMSSFAECVIRANPAGAHALLMTKVVTPQESAAFSALLPAFGSCLPANRTLALDKGPVRGAIALNYYRLAKAAQGEAVK